MSINDGPKKMSFEEGQGRPANGFLRLLRAVSLVMVVAGAVGSLSLMFRAGQRTPLFLLVLFTIWVLSPFAILLWANIVSKRWAVITQATLYGVTLVVVLGSLTIYSELVDIRPAGSANAFLFVAVPPASWVFMAIAISVAALISVRQAKQKE